MQDKIFRPGLVIFLLLTLAFRSIARAEDETVKIGFIIPLTGSVAARGDDIAKFLKLVGPKLDQISSYSYLSYHYEFIVEDGKCGTGNAAASAANKLINIDHVKFLITGCSGETLPVAPLAERNKILLFAVLALHPDVKKLGEYVFRTYIDAEKDIGLLAAYLKKNLQGQLAVLTEENPFTLGIKTYLLKHGGDLIAYSADFPADETDLAPLLLKAKASGAKGIYLNASSDSSLVNLVNAAAKLKLELRLFSYGNPESFAFRQAAGANAYGLEFLGTPDVTDSSQEFEQLNAEFYRLHPEGPSFPYVLRTTYDALKSIADGIKVVGPDPTKIKDYLKTYRVKGALGSVEYDDNGDIKNTHFVLKRVEPDGSLSVIDELTSPSLLPDLPKRGSSNAASDGSIRSRRHVLFGLE